jgi:tetratricopeptide (TPR) repeat protein
LLAEFAKAVVDKGISFGGLERHEQAIDCYDEVIDRFGAAQELVLRGLVARALNNKGNALDRLDRRAEAIACFSAIVERQSNADDSELKEIVMRAVGRLQYYARDWTGKPQK